MRQSARAVETLDIGFLRWTAWLDQDVVDAMLLHPRHKCLAGEFRSVVRSDRLGVAPKQGRPVQ